MHAWQQMGCVDVISVDVLLWAFYLLVLKDPWKDFKYIGVSRQAPDNTEVPINNGIQDGSSYPASLSERWSWVGVLLSSIRLNGWTTGSDSHDSYQIRFRQRKTITRAAFAKRALVSFIRGYLILDLTCAYQSHDPYFKDLSVSISSPLPFSGFPPRFLRALVMGAQVWALISQFIYLPCCILVVLNAANWIPDEWSPHTWQPLFGDIRIVFHRGVRGLWGQYWHQSMRPLTSGPGEATADLLRLKQKGVIRTAIVTTVAFGLSGIIHTGLVPPEPLFANIDANHVRILVASFFWLQSVIIVLEVLIGTVVAWTIGLETFEAGVGKVVKMLANALVFLFWFTATLPIFGEAARQLGYWRIWLVPISIWKGLRGEGWAAWL